MIALTSQIDTPYHRLPAGMKLAGLCLTTFVLFAASTLWIALAAAAIVAGLYLYPGTAFAREGLRHLRPLWVFVAVIAIWHGLSG